MSGHLRPLVVVALAVSLTAIACAGPAGPAGAAAAAPKVTTDREFEIKLGEAQIVGDVVKNGKTVEEVIGDSHRWEPGVLVVFVGDKVKITATNPRKHEHTFAIPSLKVDTGPLVARTGKKTVEFTADKAGIYPFQCSLDYNEAKGACDADHSSMTGQLIVLAR